jgi:hypothetical protein
MKKFLFVLFLFAINLFSQQNFDKNFFNKALRIDFFQNGDKTTEMITFDKLIEEPIWSGSKNYLVDKLNYGNYLMKIIDESSSELIYSRGFSTLFQEWQTTEEAKTVKKSMSGSLIFPYPKTKVVFEIYKRDKRNNFNKIFSYNINPDSYFIITEKRKPYPSFQVHYSGESSQKLDIVLIPEGYTINEMEKFKKDCQRFSQYLFEYSPFKEHKDKINFWGVEAPSPESGTDIPGKDIWVRTLVNSNFYTFDSERYLMTTDYHSIRDVAANAPNDQIFILVNTTKYGGGGIYNYYNVTSVDHAASKQVFVHEFGHGLAGLADEYGDDPTYQDYYLPDVEPWEPNITTLVNFNSKWKTLVKQDVPIPTPNEEKYKNEIGAFEGAGYVPKGVYRSTSNSIMRAFSSNEFNKVSKDVLEKIILTYTE